MCHFFFFNDTATTEIYTLSLHDALPIFLTSGKDSKLEAIGFDGAGRAFVNDEEMASTHVFDLKTLKADRKSTRLNSSHQIISYAVFCLKKKKTKELI